MKRDCLTCRYRLRAGEHHRITQATYTIDCCLHPKAVNRAGILAVSLARAPYGACGPDAELWQSNK